MEDPFMPDVDLMDTDDVLMAIVVVTTLSVACIRAVVDFIWPDRGTKK